MLMRSALFWDITRCRGNCLPTFRVNVSVPSSRVKGPRRKALGLLTLEGGTDTLSRNVGKQLPQYAAYYPRRAQISISLNFMRQSYVRLSHLWLMCVLCWAFSMCVRHAKIIKGFTHLDMMVPYGCCFFWNSLKLTSVTPLPPSSAITS
jgi:hypothetical protein